MSETQDPPVEVTPVVTEKPAPDPALVDPNALDRLVAKMSTSASSGEGPKRIQRRSHTVVIDPAICELDTFDAPFKLRLEGLSAEAELEAYRSGDSTTAGLTMAKKAIREMNGKPLRKSQIDLIWECLGMSGRMAVVNAFMVHCTGVDSGLGKSVKTSTED